MDVLVLGRTETLFDAARLVAKKHRIVGIITAPAAPEYSRGESDYRDLAKSLGCPFLLTKRVDQSMRSFIARAKPQVAISSHWVSTLPRAIVDLIPSGILNAHHGDLPRYRGNAATNWLLLKNEPLMYATIHFMDPADLDSGDIVARRPMQLTMQSTIRDVLAFIHENIPEMFVEVLDEMQSGTVQRLPQGRSQGATFRCYPRLPIHGKIDWSQSALEIHSLVRASGEPYAGAFTYLKVDGVLRRLTVWESRVVAEDTVDLGVPGHIIRNDSASGESWVYTGKGILALRRVQYNKGEQFAPGTVWTSIRFGFYVDVESELISLQQAIESSRRA